jgi:hypothetical protein
LAQQICRRSGVKPWRAAPRKRGRGTQGLRRFRVAGVSKSQSRSLKSNKKLEDRNSRSRTLARRAVAARHICAQQQIVRVSLRAPLCICFCISSSAAPRSLARSRLLSTADCCRPANSQRDDTARCWPKAPLSSGSRRCSDMHCGRTTSSGAGFYTLQGM